MRNRHWESKSGKYIFFTFAEVEINFNLFLDFISLTDGFIEPL